MVEIVHGIAPDHQGKGYAPGAVSALTACVLENEAVSTVRARTLPSESASTSVLRECGYQFVGKVDDPGDGRSWRCEFPERPEGWQPQWQNSDQVVLPSRLSASRISIRVSARRRCSAALLRSSADSLEVNSVIRAASGPLASSRT